MSPARISAARSPATRRAPIIDWIDRRDEFDRRIEFVLIQWHSAWTSAGWRGPASTIAPPCRALDRRRPPRELLGFGRHVELRHRCAELARNLDRDVADQLRPQRQADDRRPRRSSVQSGSAA